MAFNLQSLNSKISSMSNQEQVSSAYMQFIQRKGFFISNEAAQSVGFAPDETWKPYGHTFGTSDEEVKGYLNKSPRLLVAKKSELTVVSREGKVLGAFSKDLYNRQLHSLKIRYAVIPVNAQGLSLVKEPVLLPLKGAFQVSFSSALAEHRKQAQAVFKSLTNKTFSPDSEIWGYFLFHPQFKDVDSGYKTMVSKVTTFTEITENNIQEMLLIDNEGIEPLVKQAMEMDISYLSNLPTEPTIEPVNQPPTTQTQKVSLGKLAEKFSNDSEDSADELY